VAPETRSGSHRFWLALGLLLACASPSRRAHAYEDQLTLGVGAGYANPASSTLPHHGLLFDVSGSVGLSSELTLRARFSYAEHFAQRPMHVLLGSADLLYLWDVTTVVPYLGGGIDELDRVRGGRIDVEGGVHLAAGLDYLWSRRVALELDLRPCLLLSALRRDPWYLAITASVIFVFDH
jgi:hypothetical protein